MPGSDYQNNIRIIWAGASSRTPIASSAAGGTPTDVTRCQQELANLKNEIKQHHQEIIDIAEGRKDSEL